MAISDLDQNQTENFLSSQVKKRDGGLTEDQAKVFQKFWKLHKSRIHESLVQSCVWNNRLKNLSWRIDIRSRSRHVDQLNATTAIVEMELQDPNQKEKVYNIFNLL